jgi:esterase/lipase
MNFWEIILGLLGGGAVAGIISLYNAKANNTSIQADTFKKFFDEVQEWTRNEVEQHSKEVKELKEERKAFLESFEEYKLENKKEIETIKKDSAIKDCAINSAYRCVLVNDVHDCPVIKTMDDIIQRERLNINGRNNY